MAPGGGTPTELVTFREGESQLRQRQLRSRRGLDRADDHPVDGGYGSPVPTIDELTVADAPDAWSALGFAVDGDFCLVGGVRVRLSGRRAAGAGEAPRDAGLVGWSLHGLATTDLDGLETARSERPPPSAAPPHPNGVVAIDHIVAMTPDLDRTVAALRAAGLDLRRIREQPTPAGAPRQAFFRLGAVILEVVQEPPEAIEGAGGDHPAFFWGLAFAAPDIEATVARLGERATPVRDAIQPGRRIATLRRSAGLAVPVALITPRP
jgi:catechol 2,3-dioxygenase-like lactoylglutathione lyase family enzyme